MDFTAFFSFLRGVNTILNYIIFDGRAIPEEHTKRGILNDNLRFSSLLLSE